MKKLILSIIIVLSLCTIAYTQQPFPGWGAVKAVPSTGISDDFSGDLSKWTVENGTWDISSGTLREGNDSGYFFIRYTASATATVTQWAKVKFTDWVANYMGIVVRSTSDGSGYRYVIGKEGTSVYWSVWNGLSSIGDVGSSAISLTDGDILGVTVQGTGNNTIVNVWKNPTAASPIDANSWDGANDYDGQITANPAQFADIGTYVGIWNSCSVGNYNKFDDFSAGSF